MLKIEDIARAGGTLGELNPDKLIPLPAPYNKVSDLPKRKQVDPRYEASLDGFSALGFSAPKSAEGEEKFVSAFLSGIEKLLSPDNNWPFLKQLQLSMDHCARCQTCVEACPVYVGSGREEVYRPTFRSEVFRRLIKQHSSGKLLTRLKGEAIEVNAATLCRLLESAYRCTLCRRCAQTCPMGVDNALLTREIRKLFSMELGIAPKEIHDKGSMLQLRTGSSTGMKAAAVRDNIEFLDDEIREQTGSISKHPGIGKAPTFCSSTMRERSWRGRKIPWPSPSSSRRPGSVGRCPANLMGYDSVNYGLWYDDVQFARVAVRQAEAAKKLKVKKIVLGECGHGHKASMVTADRMLSSDLNIPRESALVLLRDIVRSGRLKLDPTRNDFPVTLHDPCNMVRMMGIVEPQREILRAICPQFREMAPHGVENYCCGGGSGFAIMSGYNFEDWRFLVSGRMKLKQVLDTFADCPDPGTKKYVCAPCSNCKGQFRDLFRYYGVWEKSGILYGGLAELIVNAMSDLKEPFIKWEFH